MSPVPRPSTRARRAAAIGATAALATALAMPAQASVVAAPFTTSAADAALALTPIGSHDSGVFDESAAEIVVFHAATARLFAVDANAGSVRVLDASDPTAPTDEGFSLDARGVTAADGSVIPEGAVANSVAVREDGLVVVAVENDPKTDDGWLVFFDAAGEGEALGAVRAGALPDMVTITPDGKRAVAANEGEPNADYSIDPEGSITVVRLPKKVEAPKQQQVKTATFHAFEDALPDGVRIFAGLAEPVNPVSEGLEPEYVTVDAASHTAYVTLQENNAVAVVDLPSARVTALLPLGAKDHSLSENALDPSDKDGIAIRTAPVMGLYMPDAIASYTADGETYLVTANEGDARDDWNEGVDEFEESTRIEDLLEDGLLCDNVIADIADDEDLLRLDVTTASGFNEAEGCYDQLYSFGARSFSIWTADGEQVFDSGSDFEDITADLVPEYFNMSNDDHDPDDFDSRSDAKGPEPEAVTIGEIDGRTYAFIGLERIGGIMVYDVTDPAAAFFVTYVNNRDFTVDADAPEAGDLGPEGLAFIPAEDSPTGEPLLAVANEVSGTTTLFAIEVD